MISQYMVDRLRESGFKVLEHTESEVRVKVRVKGSPDSLEPVEYEDVFLYDDREIRNFLTVHV